MALVSPKWIQLGNPGTSSVRVRLRIPYWSGMTARDYRRLEEAILEDAERLEDEGILLVYVRSVENYHYDDICLEMAWRDRRPKKEKFVEKLKGDDEEIYLKLDNLYSIVNREEVKIQLAPGIEYYVDTD